MLNWLKKKPEPTEEKKPTANNNRQEPTINMSANEDLIPTSKLKANIANLPQTHTGQLVVLVSTGSLSPIHRMHVHMFEVAKKALEEKHGYTVVGGFMSPSHDLYVMSKLGEAGLNSTHRLKLCDLSTSESTWIAPSKWEISQEWFVDYPSVARFHTKYLTDLFPHNNLKVMYLCGADHAIRCRLYNAGTFDVVAVGRPSYSAELSKIINSTTKDLIEDETEDISSTEIRRRLKEKLPFDDLMYPAAAAYLVSIHK